MADVTIKIFSGAHQVAVRAYGSPLTAAEAKEGLRGEEAAWVGALTAENSSTLLVGQRQLIAGSTYHLNLRQQAGKALRLLCQWQQPQRASI